MGIICTPSRAEARDNLSSQWRWRTRHNYNSTASAYHLAVRSSFSVGDLDVGTGGVERAVEE